MKNNLTSRKKCPYPKQNTLRVPVQVYKRFHRDALLRAAWAGGRREQEGRAVLAHQQPPLKKKDEEKEFGGGGLPCQEAQGQVP